jgi:hypothetical protein
MFDCVGGREMTGETKQMFQAQGAVARQPLRRIVVAILLALGVAAGCWFWLQDASASGPNPSDLVGRWLRPDGGYVLELAGPTPKGQLKAAYFNPRPINVSRAEWKLKGGLLSVFVELRDVNYPGSTYTLDYSPKTDKLIGIYYQAALGQRFEVEFGRTR